MAPANKTSALQCRRNRSCQHNCWGGLAMLVLSIVSWAPSIHAQVYINTEWVQTTGSPDDIHWTFSTTDPFGDLIVVGNTQLSLGNTHVLVTKYDRRGDLVWQETWAGTAGTSNYGVSALTDIAGNVFVAATVSNTGSQLDFALLKYGSQGTLAWASTWDGPASLDDIPVGIAIDSIGNIYLAGTTWTDPLFTDFALVKFDAQGDLLWDATYDHAGLIDGSAGLELDENGHPIISGVSAADMFTWEMAALRYDGATGDGLDTLRVEIPGLGLQRASAMAIDDTGNIYLTGYYDDGTQRDVQTLKIGASFSMAWLANFDHVGDDDEGLAVAADAAGNVYVAGFAGNGSGGTEFLTMKYSPLGELIWRRLYLPKDSTWKSMATRLAVSDDGVIVTGTVHAPNGMAFATVKYRDDGKMAWAKTHDTPLHDGKAMAMALGYDGAIYVSGVMESNGGNSYATVKYDVFQSDNPVVLDSLNNPNYLDGELIVKFRSHLIDTTFVDNMGMQHTMLDLVVPDSVTSAIESVLGLAPGMASRIKTLKIFSRLTRADSISLSRNGNVVRVPQFWSVLLLHVEGINSFSAADSLTTLSQFIDYAEVNAVGYYTSVPNDPHFVDYQAGLIPNSTYPSGSINLAGAWEIQTGQPYVKVGVFDDPIYWAHEDFGDGSFPGSKVAGGQDFFNAGLDIESVTNPPNSHGTAVAGVIGALRNNGIGVTGVAGGDVDSEANTGVALYSMAIFNNNSLAPMSVVTPAIVDGALSSGYGLHIQNHSWATNINNTLLRMAVNTCFQNECLFVVGRGNGGVENLYFPACTGWDEWRLSVGASGINGKRHTSSSTNSFSSSFGIEMDVIAPGVTELVATTQYSMQPYTWPACSLSGEYTCFNGTSAASAHVSGIAALLMSEYNVENGRDNNLAPDDIEFLIQRYATDITEPLGTYLVGYDAQSGWGRVDAANTIEKITWPNYSVFHSGTPSTTSQSALGSSTVIVEYPINGISPGSYTANKVQVVHTYSNSFTPSTEILDSWGRFSGTTGFNNVSYLDGRMYGTYVFTITNNTATVSATTMAYQINGQWIPAPPGDLKTAYTLHLYDSEFTAINEETTVWTMSAYPNPANDVLNIFITSDEPAQISYEILDVTGRFVYGTDLGFRANVREALSVGELASGTYLLRLVRGSEHLTRKFIKY